MWYVSYRLAGATMMRVFKTRPRAIRVACEILAEAKPHELRVGPMLDDDAVLSGDALRRICAIVRGEPRHEQDAGPELTSGSSQAPQTAVGGDPER